MKTGPLRTRQPARAFSGAAGYDRREDMSKRIGELAKRFRGASTLKRRFAVSRETSTTCVE